MLTLFVCWAVFPVVLGLVALGCGLFVESVSGSRLPGALLAALGVAVIVVVGDLATMSGATARLTTPVVVAFAVAGYGLSFPWRGRRIDGWALACAVGVLAVYAAPIVLSGKATFAGYITLDDTSTWFGLTDRVFEHGRTLSGLAPSTYQQVLTDDFNTGYPLGSFMVLGVGAKLIGQDVAWLFQPTLALFASMLALTIYAASARLVSSKPLRALVAFLGAQPALLFAYALWSGIKELAAAAALALVCALVVSTLERWRSVRGVVPVAVAVAALLAELSVAGGVWLIVPGVIILAVLVRRGLDWSVRGAAALVALVAVLSVPSLVVAHKFLSGAVNNEVTSSSEVANLGHPLSTLQLFGIWPATDFRTAVHDRPLTYILIGVLIAAAAVGLLLAVRRRAWGMPFYVATGVGGALLALLLTHVGLSSPWLNAKALAEASPALVAAGVAGAAAVFETGRRTEAVLACAAIAVGVIWSNTLAYENAWLAPRSQLAELQSIGNRFAGDGPTLMTEYQPYGVRHFLRRLDPESASERRTRLIPLRSGVGLAKGRTADLDAFDLNAVLVYRTLVLRRSPVESRPPVVYRLVWTGHWYEVWQRPEQSRTILVHLSLGTAADPAAVPRCTQVLRLAQRAAAAGGLLAAVVRDAAPLTLDLARGTHPARWSAGGDPGTLVPTSAGTVTLEATVPRAGRYGLWLGGSFRRTVTAVVDGHDVGSVTHQLNDTAQWTPLGAATLGAGPHNVVLRYGGSRLAPGRGGFPFAMGPLVLSTTTADLPVTSATPDGASSLCGRRLDWVEALGR